MPPFLLNADGSCRTYQDSLWMTEDEIATVNKWIDLGMPTGDKAKDPGKADPLPTLEGASEYKLPVEYEPADDSKGGSTYDDYRCFPIQLNLGKDQYVTAVEVVPDNETIVHHVLAFAVNPKSFSMNSFSKSNQQVMDELDSKHNSRPGWPCYGAVGEGVLPGPMVIGWAPGTGAVKYPDKTGIKLTKDDILVVQMHYNVTQPGAKDRTKLRLKMVDKVDAKAWFVLHDPFLFGKSFMGKQESLKAGEKKVDYTWNMKRSHLTSFSLPKSAGNDFLVHGAFPHMHKYGRKMKMTVKQGDGAAQCAVDVHHWDFNWQRMYYWDEPIKFDTKTNFEVTCSYDTTSADKDVLAGFGTADEMCLMGFYISEPL